MGFSGKKKSRLLGAAFLFRGAFGLSGSTLHPNDGFLQPELLLLQLCNDDIIRQGARMLLCDEIFQFPMFGGECCKMRA